MPTINQFNSSPFTSFYEAYFSKNDAFNREKQLKKNKSGYRELRKRLADSLK
jgi:hypothetical protein